MQIDKKNLNQANTVQKMEKNGPHKSTRADLSPEQEAIFLELQSRLQNKLIENADENLLIRCLIGREYLENLLVS